MRPGSNSMLQRAGIFKLEPGGGLSCDGQQRSTINFSYPYFNPLAPSLVEQNSRPVFKSSTGLLLHHTSLEGDGTWMVSDPAASTLDGGVVAFISSWAMHPTHIATVSPKNRWSSVETTHTADDAARVDCVGEDRSVHLQAVGHEGAAGHEIMRGFFFETGSQRHGRPVFVQVIGSPPPPPRNPDTD